MAFDARRQKRAPAGSGAVSEARARNALASKRCADLCDATAYRCFDGAERLARRSRDL
jgi:hypothetical protein